jgi:hypothetical protein
VNLTSSNPAIGDRRTGPGSVSYTIGLYGGPISMPLVGKLIVYGIDPGAPPGREHTVTQTGK